MNHYYVLAGYNKQKDQLNTQVYKTVEEVIDIINWWWKKAGKGEVQFDNKDAFEAQAQATSKNGYAFPIDTNPLVLWNVYYV